MKRVMDLPIIQQTFDVADEFLEKIGETRACFVAGTQVVVADSPFEEALAMSTPESAEVEDGLSTLALAAATVPVALTGYGRLRRRKRREPLSELDELFSADDLFPEPSAPPRSEEHTTPADPPRRHARPRFGPTLALAWLVGWLAVGGFLFVQGTAPADRPGAAPAVAASAPVEEAPAYRTKNIEDLQPNELVLAADPQSGRVEPKRVLEVYRRTSTHLRLLTFADRSGREQRIETTDEHPFWVPDRDEFVDAGNLSAGDKVVGPHGEVQWLVSTVREPHPEGIEVFNFKVEDFHTYFVAAHGRRGPPLLVHNTDCLGGTGAAYDALTGQGLYILRDPEETIRYIGRGDAPERLAYWARPGSGNEDLAGEILWRNDLTDAQARSLEQELMQLLGGPQSLNPDTQLRNIIQAIGERNPDYLDLEFAAGDELLIETLRRARLLEPLYLPRVLER